MAELCLAEELLENMQTQQQQQQQQRATSEPGPSNQPSVVPAARQLVMPHRWQPLLPDLS